MTQDKKYQVRDAVAWLLFAYTVGHQDACACERCVPARKIAFASKKHAAA